MGRLEKDMRMEVATMWEAFSSFAREVIGVEAKTLIKSWFEPMLSEIEAVEDTLGVAEMNAEKLEEYGSTLRRLWSELVP